jgi:hypothetical protein
VLARGFNETKLTGRGQLHNPDRVLFNSDRAESSLF